MPPRRAATLGSHNRSWIWGRHAVLETLRAGGWRPLEVLLSPRCAAEVQSEVRRHTHRLQVPLQEASDVDLRRRCRADDHQGLAALMPPFPYVSFAELIGRKPLPTAWLVLDRVQDSFNFGAMVRAAHALGIDAVLIGDKEQSHVNSQVVRSSAGAVNFLPIVRVDDLPAAVAELRRQGIQPIAATEKGAQLIDGVNLRAPVAVVIGNEGCGIQQPLLAQCSTHVRIPMWGRVGSLNAAVAAGICCYEINRQRRTS